MTRSARQPNTRYGSCDGGTTVRFGGWALTGSWTSARKVTTQWWRTLPLDRVTRVHGSTFRSLAESVDPLPDSAPVVTFFASSSDRRNTASGIAAVVVDALERAAVDLTSLWLPGAASFPGPSMLDRQAARLGAVEFAGNGPHFGPYVAALADAAVTGRAPGRGAFALETRATGAARLIAAAHGRHDCAIVIDVPASQDRTAVATAAEWLSAHAGVGVWLTGSGSEDIDRFPSAPVYVKNVPAGISTGVDRIRPLGYPPVGGHPHPGSEPEKLLHRTLDGHDWASEREHNRTLRTGELSQPFTVDILWRAERVVVEIDGGEHRAAARFAEDRMRDNQLQTHGYIVLRFTNAQVVTDPAQVAAAIRRVVTARRSKGTHR